MSGGRTKASANFRTIFLVLFILLCVFMAFATGTAGWLIPNPLLFIAIFISISNGREKTRAPHDSYHFEHETLSKSDLTGSAKSKDVGKSVYYLPDRCPHFGGCISMEKVSWTGPMTALSPYCSGSTKLELRDL